MFGQKKARWRQDFLPQCYVLVGCRLARQGLWPVLWQGWCYLFLFWQQECKWQAMCVFRMRMHNLFALAKVVFFFEASLPLLLLPQYAEKRNHHQSCYVIWYKHGMEVWLFLWKMHSRVWSWESQWSAAMCVSKQKMMAKNSAMWEWYKARLQEVWFMNWICCKHVLFPMFK